MRLSRRSHVPLYASPRAQWEKVLRSATYLIVRYVYLLNHLDRLLLYGENVGVLCDNVALHCATRGKFSKEDSLERKSALGNRRGPRI